MKKKEKTIKAKNEADSKCKTNAVNLKTVRKYKALYFLYAKLFEFAGMQKLTTIQNELRGILIIYPEDMQAELYGAHRLSINQRQRIHITVYNYMRNKYLKGK